MKQNTKYKQIINKIWHETNDMRLGATGAGLRLINGMLRIKWFKYKLFLTKLNNVKYTEIMFRVISTALYVKQGSFFFV